MSAAQAGANSSIRDSVPPAASVAIDSRRSAIAVDLSFNDPPARYDFGRDVVIILGQAPGSSVTCEISRKALDDHFGIDGLDQKGRVEAFLKNRSRIELMARTKCPSWPIEELGTVLIKTIDVPRLLQEITAARPSPSPRRSRK